MLIIALSGKAGVGKTTTARAISARFNFPVLTSFGNALKDECAKTLCLERMKFNTEDGKNEYIPTAAALQLGLLSGHVFEDIEKVSHRETLQIYGTEYRRKQDPDYWVKRTIEFINKCDESHHDAVIIDDVRFVNEADAIKRLRGYIIRLDPFPGWVPGKHAKHISETALDCYAAWDLRFTPAYKGTAEVAKSITSYTELFPRSLTKMAIPSSHHTLTED